MVERVVTELVVDARGAAAGVAQYNAAMDSAHAKAEQVREASMRMLTGIPQSAESVTLAIRKLQASLDPVAKAQFAAEQQMTKSMALIERAVRLGVTTEQQAANTIAAIRQKQVRDLEAVRNAQLATNATAISRGRPAANTNFNTANVAAQFQDIAITSAMGMSPLQIALQQGTQLQSVLGPLGVRGAVTALGSAFTSLINPVSLATLGFVALTAVAIQFGSKLLPEVKKLDDAIEDQRKSVMALGEAYGIAGLKAEDFGRKSVIAAEAAARRDTEALRKAADTANKEALGQLTTFVTPGRSAGGFFGPTSPQFAAFNDVIQKLNAGVKAGHPDFEAFEQGISDVVANNPGLQTTADKILGIVAAAAAANEQLGKTDRILKDINRSSVGGPGSVDRLREQGQAQTGLMRRMNPGAFGEPRNQVQEEIDATRRQQAQLAEIMSLSARSPAQRAAAARQREAAIVRDGEREEEFRDRVNAAGKLERARAEHELAEAYRERGRALEETITSSRLDLELIGKTTGEQAALRMEFEKTQELRQQAAQNGIEVDQKEIDLIQQKAVEYGNLAAAIQKANLLRDIQFERDQLFRSPGDQQIASRLRGTGMGLDSEAADAMRWNQNFAELKDGVRGFFDDFEEGLLNGDDIGEALGKAILNGLNKVLDRMLDQVLNQLANSITSAIMGSGAPNGGGGILGAILAGGTGGGDPWAGLRNVTGGPNTPATAARLLGGLGSPLGNAGIDSMTTGSLTGNISLWAQAIRAIESGGSGGYSALGPITRSGDRAYGAYQVMGNNIPSWSEKWLGQRMTPNAFLNDPSAQDKVFAGQFGSSVGRHGLEGGVRQWFTGSPTGRASDQLGTSGDQYVSKFNTALGRASSTAGSAAKDIGELGRAGSDASKGLGELDSGLKNLGGKLSGIGGGGGSGGGSWLSNLFGGGGGGGSGFGFDGPGGFNGGPGSVDWLFGGWHNYARGGVFAGGNVIPFARGGVVDRPTLFPMANGAGLMGEAGPEAVMPLRRGANGSLGVAMHGGGGVPKISVNVINNGAPVTAEQGRTTTNSDGSINVEVMMDTVESRIAKRATQPGTPIDKALSARNARQALKRYG